ncbi:MAG: metal ABC transporter permease, partial [Acidimicrobiia bacterium]|nr:metal ABC transporter permease [Acidimicrobiia bacterium]
MGWLTDPIAWWVEPFTDNTFMREALAATVLAVACTSVIGTWVVLRGLAFLGDALAHGVLPGIALAWVVGIDTSIGAIIAALVMVGGVGLIRQSSPLPDDASIGVLFVGFLALAVVIMSTSAGTGDLTRFLFGSISAVDSNDLIRLSVVTAVVLLGVAALHPGHQPAEHAREPLAGLLLLRAQRCLGGPLGLCTRLAARLAGPRAGALQADLLRALEVHRLHHVRRRRLLLFHLASSSLGHVRCLAITPFSILARAAHMNSFETPARCLGALPLPRRLAAPEHSN